MKRVVSLDLGVAAALWALACACTELREADEQTLPVADACAGCHGSLESPAPPLDLKGGSDTTRRGVGAHQAHLNATLAQPPGCEDCHVVPATVDAAGHLDDTPGAELTFGARARQAGLKPRWTPALHSCAAVYCHGASLAGGRAAFVWTQVDGSQRTCDACHGAPPPAPHPQDAQCGACHPGLDDQGMPDPARHIDGTLDVAASCSACHGFPPAMPHPQSDQCATCHDAFDAEGALTAKHRNGTVNVIPAVACTACHGNPPAAPHPNSAACGDCHPGFDAQGNLTGDTHKDGTVDLRDDMSCTVCHGYPPPAPHPANNACATCHPGFDAQGELTGATHRDGDVDLRTDISCSACHGVGDDPWPTTGAHLAHRDSPFTRAAVACQYCHPLPATWTAPGHLEDDPGDLTLSGLAAAKDTSPTWDGASCSTVYCHGGSLDGARSGASWPWQGEPATFDCGFCHGYPPTSEDHPDTDLGCDLCHGKTVDTDGSLKADGFHINGKTDYSN